MGQQLVKPCCHAELLPAAKRTVAAAPVVGVCPGIQPRKTYKERYEAVSGASNSADSMVKTIRCPRTGLLYICRHILKDDVKITERAQLERYITSLCRMEHPHLCKVVEVFDTDDSFVFVCERGFTPYLLDFLEHEKDAKKEVMARKSKFNNLCSEPTAAEMVRQIMSALAHAHSRGFVHGRLRPESLLMAAEDGGGRRMREDSKAKGGGSPKNESASVRAGPPQVKICDIGLGLVFMPAIGMRLPVDENELTEDWLGSETASAEELQEAQLLASSFGHWAPGKPAHSGVSMPKVHRLDIWAVGMVAHNLLAGYTPVNDGDSDTEDSARGIILRGGVWDKTSSGARDAIQLMLRTDPKDRPTAADLLKHPWLKFDRDPVSGKHAFNLYRNACVNLQKGQFQKLLARIVINLLPTSSEHMERASRLFLSLDLNRDGLVDQEEFLSGFQHFEKLQEVIALRYDLECLFEAADRSGNAALDVTEFAALTLPQEEIESEKMLWQVFRVFDRDEDGEVTVEDVVEIARLLEGSMLAAQQLEELEGALREELGAVNIAPTVADAASFGQDEDWKEDSFDEDDDWAGDESSSGESWGGENKKKTPKPKAEPSELSKRVKKARQVVSPYVKVVRRKAKWWLPAYRRLDFGEFLYLCGETPKRRNSLSSWRRVIRKETGRAAEMLLKLDLYEELKTKKGALPWPPKEGSSASVPRSVHRQRGGLAARS